MCRSQTPGGHHGPSSPPCQNANLVYEDIQDLRATNTSNSSPSGAQDMATAYSITQCPAYNQVALMESSSVCPNTQQACHVYEDIQL